MVSIMLVGGYILRGSFKLTFSYGTECGGSPAWGMTKNVCLFPFINFTFIVKLVFYFV